MALRSHLKSRKGRRPISVHKLLAKEKKQSELYAHTKLSAALDEARSHTLSKLAGEYGKNSAGFDLQGHTTVQGLPVAIENKPGSTRSGKNDDGSRWSTTFKSPYGYIEGTKGADGEEIDAYVGPDKDASQVYIVHQKKSDGSHDEDTVMLGYPTKGDAKTDILRHYDDKSLIGSIDYMSLEEFKKKLEAAKGKAVSKIAAIVETADSQPSDEPSNPGSPLTTRKKNDVPTREMQDVYPAPKTENRQEMQEVRFVGGENPHEGSMGKWGSAVHELERAARAGFMEELSKHGGVAPDYLDDFIKEAVFREMMGGIKRGLVGGANAGGYPTQGVLSPFMGMGKKMQAFGADMRTTPAQRVMAAHPGTSMQEAHGIAQQAAGFGAKGPGAAGRIAGEAVETAGKHVTHSSPLQLALNPVGTVVGGGIEGATRGAGRELVQAAGPASKIRAGLGRAMQTHAPTAGLVGEIGTMGAMGGLIHAPLSAAGAMGTGMMHASPALASGLHAMGTIGGHVGADALGTAAQRATRSIPAMARGIGKMVSAA